MKELMMLCTYRRNLGVAIALSIGLINNRYAAATNYPLNGCTVTAGAPSTVDDGPHSSPFLTGETVKTQLTLNCEPPSGSRVEGTLSSPAISWSIVSVQISDTDSGSQMGASSPGDYNAGGTDPNASADTNASSSLGFSPGNAMTTVLWATFNSIHHFSVIVKASVNYSDTHGNSWSGTAQAPFKLVAGNWVASPTTLAPSNPQMIYQDIYGPNHSYTAYNPYDTAYGHYAWSTSITPPYTCSAGVSVAPRTSSTGPGSGTVAPQPNPVSQNIVMSMVWKPVDSPARTKTFTYTGALAADLNDHVAAVDADIGNWEPFVHSSGATIAGVRGSIMTDPSSAGASTGADVAVTHTQGDNGTISVSVGASATWPPVPSVSGSYTFSSDTWDKNADFTPNNCSFGNTVTVSQQNHVTATATLSAYAQVKWSGDANGLLNADADFELSTFSLTPYP